MRRAALRLARDELLALGAAAALLLGSIMMVAYAASARSAAAEELAERRAVLSRYAGAAASAGAGQGQVPGAGPPEALIDAPTQGQAGALLQSHFSRLAGEQRANVTSSGIEPPSQEAPDAIRVQATLELSLGALQALLHRLETGTPYVMIDALAVQPAGPPSGGAGQPESRLRVVLTLRGIWRRSAA